MCPKIHTTRTYPPESRTWANLDSILLYVNRMKHNSKPFQKLERQIIDEWNMYITLMDERLNFVPHQSPADLTMQ